jgi:hypothetical protein
MRLIFPDGTSLALDPDIAAVGGWLAAVVIVAWAVKWMDRGSSKELRRLREFDDEDR